MPNILFEAHLAQTMPGGLKGSDTALLDEESQDLIEAFKLFANGIEDGADLGEAFDCFAEYFELEPSEAEYFSEALGAVTEDIFGEASDEAVRSFLQDLNRPYPKPNETSPNKDGMTPLAGELAAKRVLKSLTTQDHPDPYGNQGFKADRYKAFSRSKNHFGYDYSYDNDFNNQTPSRPLANPILNVAFEAVDSVGMGSKTHYRVVNNLTGEYVTRNLPQEVAEHVAADLNDDFIAEVEQLEQQELQEVSRDKLSDYQMAASDDYQRSGRKVQAAVGIGDREGAAESRRKKTNRSFGLRTAQNKLFGGNVKVRATEESELQEGSYPSRKHFQQVANEVRKIRDEPSRQAVADHHAGIFKQQNPRFDHDRFHAACNTKTRKERGLPTKLGEETRLPATAIQESILKPISQDRMKSYMDAFKKTNFTMGGSVAQSSYDTTVFKDLKAAALLVEQRKRKFHEDDGVTEASAIKAVSQRNLHKNKNKK